MLNNYHDNGQFNGNMVHLRTHGDSSLKESRGIVYIDQDSSRVINSIISSQMHFLARVQAQEISSNQHVTLSSLQNVIDCLRRAQVHL